MQKIRDFLNSPAGKAIGVALVVLGVLLALWTFRNTFVTNELAASVSGRTYMCSKTLKSFTADAVVGETIPVMSPHSNERTGYPAEMCGWTKDGGIRNEPFPVLLKSHLGQKGPTFCPDCGRLVVPRNPVAVAEMKPSPTEAEYGKRRGESDE